MLAGNTLPCICSQAIRGLAIIFLLLTWCSCSSDHAVSNYTLTPIGGLPGYSVTHPVAINTNGWVVGYAYEVFIDSAGNDHAFLWHEGEFYTALAFNARYPRSRIYGINNQNDVVGEALYGTRYGLENEEEKWQMLPAAWPKVYGSNYTIPMAVSHKDGSAFAINENLEIVGTDGKAVLWRKRKQIDLGAGADSRAIGINNRGEIIGYSGGEFYSSKNHHPFVWRRGKRTLLPSLGGKYAACFAISDEGLIVGWSATQDGAEHACLWEGDKPQDLGTLGGNSSRAAGINRQGLIVGWSQIANGKEVACLWKEGKPIDLNTLLPADSGWVLENARAINDKGQIVARGTYKGKPNNLLLTPISP